MIRYIQPSLHYARSHESSVPLTISPTLIPLLLDPNPSCVIGMSGVKALIWSGGAGLFGPVDEPKLLGVGGAVLPSRLLLLVGGECSGLRPVMKTLTHLSVRSDKREQRNCNTWSDKNGSPCFSIQVSSSP